MALLQKLQFVAKQYKDPRVFIFTRSLLIDSHVGILMLMAREEKGTAQRGAAAKRFLNYLLSNNARGIAAARRGMEVQGDALTNALTFYAQMELERLVEAAEGPLDQPGAAVWSSLELRGYRSFLEQNEWAAPLIPWLAKEVNKWVKDGMPATDGSPRLYADPPHPLRYVDNLRLIADWVRGARPNIMSYSLKQADEDQAVWHREQAEKDRLRAAKEAQESYGDPVFSYGGYDFYDLKTKAQLKTEGCAQGICVGRTDQNYWKRVQEGRAKIYSMRREGKGVATIEVEVSPMIFEPEVAGDIVQVRSRFNENVKDYGEIEAIGKFALKFSYDSTIEPWHSWLRGARPAHRQRLAGISGFVRAFGRG